MRYLLCSMLLLAAGGVAANPAGDPLCPETPADPEDKVVDSVHTPAAEKLREIDNAWYWAEEAVLIEGPEAGNVYLWFRELKEGAYFAEEPTAGFALPYLIEEPRSGTAVWFELPPLPWFVEADADAGYGLQLYYYIGPPETTAQMTIYTGNGELISEGGLLTGRHFTQPIRAAQLEYGLAVLLRFDELPADCVSILTAVGVLPGNEGWPDLIDNLPPDPADW
jgi:hypothetical protein